MTDHDPQDVDARLSAADPALNAPDPDIAAIRAKVLAEPDATGRESLATGAAADTASGCGAVERPTAAPATAVPASRHTPAATAPAASAQRRR